MLQLVDNGVYILQKVAECRIPSSVEDLQTDMKSMVRAMSLMKVMNRCCMRTAIH